MIIPGIAQAGRDGRPALQCAERVSGHGSEGVMVVQSQVDPAKQLETYGPERCDEMTLAEARVWCRRLTRGRNENFSVLSALVPRDSRDDFAAVYAFCRWADDLGDEMGDRETATRLLGWWRRELKQCFAGEPRHPVFVALEPVVRERDLPIEPFEDLISAFEQDQHVTRFETWDDVIAYCRLSANPVGRLVLMVLGERRDDEAFARSDAICTALQLTNHWQDIRRDAVDRDRVYIPADMNPIDRFEERLLASARQGYAVDQTFLGESREVVRSLVDRTWPLYEEGDELLSMLGPVAQPIVWLLAAGGQRVLRRIEMWNYETVLHRPKLSWLEKRILVARAALRRRRAPRVTAS